MKAPSDNGRTKNSLMSVAFASCKRASTFAVGAGLCQGFQCFFVVVFFLNNIHGQDLKALSRFGECKGNSELPLCIFANDTFLMVLNVFGEGIHFF